MPKIRSVKEVRADIEAIQAEVEQLQAKAQTDEGLTDEEAARLEELVSQLEAAKSEEKVASATERYQDLKAKDEEVTRTLPVFTKAPQIIKSDYRMGRGFAQWANFNAENADQSHEMMAKLRSAGFNPHSSRFSVPVDFRRVNFKNRTILSTSGSNAGAELDYNTYSDLVFKHLTYETPLIGFMKTETIDNGRERFYYQLNNTSMVSVDNNSSGGSELNPTFPERNIVTAKNEIKPKTINSGYQKITFEMLNDSPVNLEAEISEASNLSHARKIDLDLLTGAGDGVTNVQGLLSLVSELADADEWSIDVMEDLVDAQPSYYRAGSIFVSSEATKSDVRRTLKDTTGRSLFDKAIVADQNFDSLLGYTWVTSPNVPAGQVLFINPDHYTVVYVSQQVFQRYDEKFDSHIAWKGMMRFGGARTGSASAFHSVTLSAS